MVPHALLEFSRSVLQGTFASVVQKQAWPLTPWRMEPQVSTFKCDRAVDIDFNFSLTVDAAARWQPCSMVVLTSVHPLR